MKTNFLMITLLLLLSVQLNAQERKAHVAVAYFDVKGLTLEPSQLGNLARKELAKTDLYRVMDQYDMEYILDQNTLDITNCFGRLCLVEAGKLMEVDKILTGSVELYEANIIVTIRLIDIGKAEVEKTEVMEFLDLHQQIQSMLRLTIEKMFELPSDQDLLIKLTKQFDYSNAINMPEVDRLRLNGPRMGFTYITGEAGKIFEAPEHEGGFDAYPLLFQFGYQMEVQYLNQGDFQALFEFIPIITGLDQGLFLPSLSILNGLRSNRTGWEFAFGPVLYLTAMADGYYDDTNQWHLLEEWDNPDEENPFPVVSRMDSRGDLEFISNFVFGIGKTLKSGNLNIPINFFFIPNKEGHRFGLSLGFNASSFKRK